jgi:hypothetical protein
MKSLGYAVLIAAVVIGGLVLSNVISRMSREECARQCPANRGALETVFSFSNFELVLCHCGAANPPP